MIYHKLELQLLLKLNLCLDILDISVQILGKIPFTLDTLYMIDFNNVNVMMTIYKIRCVEKFYKKHVKAQKSSFFSEA